MATQNGSKGGKSNGSKRAPKAKPPAGMTPLAWVSGYVSKLNATERKVFDALSLDKRNARIDQAYQEYQAERAAQGRVRTSAPAEPKVEQIAIALSDGTIGHVDVLPEPTNRGPARIDTPRGEMIAKKTRDAMVLGGKVVLVTPL